MKCDWCELETSYLLDITDERTGKTLQVCKKCNDDIINRLDDLVDDDVPPYEDPDRETTVVSITMDSRMWYVLKSQAEIEGFINVQALCHTILFRFAVAAKIEDLADPETPEEEAAFTHEIRGWLKME